MESLLKAFRPFPGAAANANASKAGGSIVGMDDNKSASAPAPARAASPTKGIASQLKNSGAAKFRANAKPAPAKDQDKPYYVEGEHEDSLDLQYKSLRYMFERTDIATTQGFASDAAVGGVGVAGAGGSDRHRDQMKKEVLKKEYQKHQKELREGFKRSTSQSGSKINLDDLLANGEVDTHSKLGAVLDKFDQLDLGQNSDDELPDTIREENEIDDGHQDNASDTDSFVYHFTRLSDPARKKLDVMYNKPAFYKALSNDKHRVLIDWKKNKFRALCILSGTPPSIKDKIHEYEMGKGNSPVKLGANRFPTRSTPAGKSPLEISPGYSFVILPSTSSERIYVETLATSGLYAEHYINIDTRRKLAKEALALAKRTKAMAAVQAKAKATGRSITLGPNGLPIVSATQIASVSTASFSRNDRTLIITTYLRKLAFEVQVDRLYKALYRERIKKLEKEKGYAKDLLSIPENGTEPEYSSLGRGSRSTSQSNLAIASSRLPSLSSSSSSANFLVATPANGVTVSPKAQIYSKEERYYIKKAGGPEIPFSHRSTSTSNSQLPTSAAPTIPLSSSSGNLSIAKASQMTHSSAIVYAKNVPTTKPRITSSHSGTISRMGVPMSSAAGSRSTSPQRGGTSRASSYGNLASPTKPNSSGNSGNGFQFSLYTHRPDHNTENEHPSYLVPPTPISPSIRKKRSYNGLSSTNKPNLTPSSSAYNLTPKLTPSFSSHSNGRGTSMGLSRSPSKDQLLSLDSHGENEPLRGGPSARKASGNANVGISNSAPSSATTSSNLGGYYHSTPSGPLKGRSSNPSRLGSYGSYGTYDKEELEEENIFEDPGAGALVRTVSKEAAQLDEIRKEVMAQTRKAVEQRLERERLLLEAEKKLK